MVTSRASFLYFFFLGPIIVILIFNWFNLRSQERIVDEIYYFVNDKIITKLDFEEKKDFYLKVNPTYQEQNDTNGWVMSNIIFSQLLFDSLKEKNNLIDNPSVENEIKKIMNRQGITSLEIFKVYLSQNKIDYQDYFDSLKRKLNQNIFFADNNPSTLPTDEEVEKYYQENKNKYKITNPIFDLAVIRIVLVESLNFSNRKKFQNQLLEIKEQIEKNKTPFPQVLKQFNDFKKNLIARRLGWVEIDDLQINANYRSQIINLKKGQISPVIQNPEGLNLFLIYEKKNQGPLPYSLAKNKAKQEIIKKKRTRKIRKKIQSLFKNAYLKNNHPLFNSLAQIIDSNV